MIDKALFLVVPFVVAFPVTTFIFLLALYHLIKPWKSLPRQLIFLALSAVTVAFMALAMFHFCGGALQEHCDPVDIHGPV